MTGNSETFGAAPRPVSYTHLDVYKRQAYSGEIETLNLETGDIADYRTTAQGMELEVLDAEEKRLAVLYFRWDEVAPLLRGMYARQLDGFGQDVYKRQVLCFVHNPNALVTSEM